jgi:hypothetical protein
MKFEVTRAKLLIWPNKCVTCGGNATTSYTASRNQLAGYEFKFFLHEYKEAISYPICQTHKYTIMIIRLLYFISFLSIIFSGIFVLGFTVLTLVPPKMGLIICAIFLISIITFIVFFNLQPVRLKNTGKYFTIIVIRNKQYAQEFARVNSLDPL